MPALSRMRMCGVLFLKGRWGRDALVVVKPVHYVCRVVADKVSGTQLFWVV